MKRQVIACQTPDCGSTFKVFERSGSLDEQLRAARWRVFDGETVGGKPLRDVRCPTCSKPDPGVVADCREIEAQLTTWRGGGA